MENFSKVEELLREFKGDTYFFSNGTLAPLLVNRAALIWFSHIGSNAIVDAVSSSLESGRMTIAGVVPSVRSNKPRKDALRFADDLSLAKKID